MGRILSFREIHQRLRPGISERASRAYFWRLVREGKFPAPLKLSAHRIGWREEDIDEFLASRPLVHYAPTPEADAGQERRQRSSRGRRRTPTASPR